MVEGLVDYLNKKKVRVFGPNKFASQLEGSKSFMKNLCKENDIPTANFGIFSNLGEATGFIKKNGAPIVVKADGLAGGKGVSVCFSIKEALRDADFVQECASENYTLKTKLMNTIGKYAKNNAIISSSSSGFM